VKKARDLCDLDRVRDKLGLKAEQTSNDEVIERMIHGVSEQAYRLTGREFVALNAALDPVTDEVVVDPETRTVYGTGLRELRVGDLSSFTEISIGGSVQDVVPILGLPAPRGALLPVRRLRFPAAPLADVAIAITGVWGWPEIPEDVQELVADEVAIRYHREIAVWSETFNLEESRVDRPRALTPKVYEGLLGYRDLGPVFV
jgi:hypothetical protein